MVKLYEGRLVARDYRFGIAVARFNEFISSKLLSGCLDALKRHDALEENLEIAWVPGAFELPLLAQKMTGTGRFDAVICLGAVIRGATPHFEYVTSEAAKGIAKVSLDSGVPVIFGLVTSDTLEQAIERAGTKAGNKGWDAALNAIEMADLLKKIG
ncbi:MAG: 6,7-dimethyl-8-ribityllumazine synthase [Syntrophomonadaceae bacterium]|nr:6,7-dimethyl-8-ribityllumazine synthase [Bacillota bacterium]